MIIDLKTLIENTALSPLLDDNEDWQFIKQVCDITDTDGLNEIIKRIKKRLKDNYEQSIQV